MLLEKRPPWFLSAASPVLFALACTAGGGGKDWTENVDPLLDSAGDSVASVVDSGESGGDTDSTDTSATEDADGDGYAIPEDCDDGNAAVHPGAAEVCGDGVDNDCSGDESPCRAWDVGVQLADAEFDGASDAAFGTQLTVGDLGRDGAPDLVAASFLWSGTGLYGLVDLYALPAHGLVQVDEAVAEIQRSDSHVIVRALAVGDLDGDGLGDIVVAPSDDGTYIYSGVNLIGPSAQFPATFIESAAVTLSIADWNGDGQSDMLLGASLLAGPIAAGGTAAELARLTVTSSDSTIYLASVDSSSALGDLDGDGVDEVVIGASVASSDSGFFNETYIFVIDGSLEGDVDASSAETTIHQDGPPTGPDPSSGAGSSIAIADSNGDGYPDLVLGSEADAVFVLGDRPAGYNELVDVASATIDGGEGYNRFGLKVSAGDTDGDVYADLLVGAPYDVEAAEYAGAAWLLHGPFDGAVDVSIDGAGGTKYLGAEPSAELGQSVALSDADGDGLDDVFISATPENGMGTVAGGAVYLFYSP